MQNARHWTVDMRIIDEPSLRAALLPADAVDAVERAFGALARGAATLPPITSLELPEVSGEVHVKGAYLHDAPVFVFKVASGFWQNPQRGLPAGSGLMLAFSATTGVPQALLLDNGWLTDLRTGAAGAVAAKYLAKRSLRRIAILGSGVQARHQMHCLAAVRELAPTVVWSRDAAHADACATRLADELAIATDTAPSPRAAVDGADLVITVTPSRRPLVRAEWLAPGVHVTAVGSDGPDKQELDTDVLAVADLLIVDHREQCARVGELHHGLTDGVITEQDVAAELGELVIGTHPGRTSEDQITVCDLTGVGVQDAAICALALDATHDTSDD